MNRFKLISILIIIMLAVSACGGGTNSNKETGNAANENVAAPSEDENEVSGEITVWAWALEADYLGKTVIPAFEEVYPSIKVNLETIGNDQIYDKLTAGLIAGGSGLPDVTQMAVNKLPTFVTQFPDAFVEIAPLGFDKHINDFPESTIEAVKNLNGEVVAFPRDLGPVAVFYRVDIFEEAGVDPSTIVTWDDYIEAGKIIKEKTGVAMIGNRIGNQDDILRIMLQQQGKYYFDAEGNIDVNTEEMRRALDKINEMYDAGILLNTYNWDGQVAAMKNGKVATNPDAVWWSGTMLDQMPELSGKWGTFPLPVFAEGGVHAADNGGSALTILSASKNKEAAYLFAEFASANKDMQLQALEKYGLFPAYKTVYDEPSFNANNEYFNNEPVFKNFAEVVAEIPPVNFTDSNLIARQIATDQLAALILQGLTPDQVIDNMASQLKQMTGRTVN
jgi:lactose/L-arabinose transport system substrate-binding protein